MLRCAKGCQGLCSAPGNPTVRCSRDSLKCGLCAPVSTAAAVVVRDASKSITSPSTSVSSQIFAMQDHKIPVFSYLEKNMNLWDNIVVRFNAEPESGIEALVESKMVERDRVEDIAGFLYASYGLDPESLGKFLGKK